MSAAPKKINIENINMSHNKAQIDLRKEPDYDQYKMIQEGYSNNFEIRCNQLSKLGWEPLGPPFAKGENNYYYAQQWVFRAKREEKKIEQKPLKVEVVGTVLMKKPWEDDEDY